MQQTPCIELSNLQVHITTATITTDTTARTGENCQVEPTTAAPYRQTDTQTDRHTYRHTKRNRKNTQTDRHTDMANTIFAGTLEKPVKAMAKTKT